MASEYWDKRKCPICNVDSTYPNAVISSAKRAEELDFDELRNYFVGIRSNQVFFSYYECTKCNLLYCPWYFNENQLAELYSDMPDNLMGDEKSVISKTQTGYVRWFSKRVQHFKDYLEIGPDIGLVANEIDKKFSIKNAYLIEPNLAVRPQLLESMPNTEQVGIYDKIEEIGPITTDLIVGIHVFDHLIDPKLYLSGLTKKASEYCNLLIVVHNEKSLLRRIMGRKFPPFCLQHPQLFNPKTMKNILQCTGWEIIDQNRTVNWFKLANILSLGLSLFGAPTRFGKVLPNIQIPLFLGNRIYLAKSKHELKQ